jgi:hypothetical protein
MKHGYPTSGSENCLSEGINLSPQFWKLIISRDTQKLQTLWPDSKLIFHFGYDHWEQNENQRKIQTVFSVASKELHAALEWEMGFHENIIVKFVVVIFGNMNSSQKLGSILWGIKSNIETSFKFSGRKHDFWLFIPRQIEVNPPKFYCSQMDWILLIHSTGNGGPWKNSKGIPLKFERFQYFMHCNYLCRFRRNLKISTNTYLWYVMNFTYLFPLGSVAELDINRKTNRWIDLDNLWEYRSISLSLAVDISVSIGILSFLLKTVPYHD